MYIIPNLDHCTEIIDNLWIGQQPNVLYDALYDISVFKYIICCNGTPHYNIKPWQTVVVAPFDDSHQLPPDEFLHNLGNLALEFSIKGKTLVHCTAGVNRSATIVALALIKRGLSSIDSIKLVRSRRGECLICNKDFEKWLHLQN